MPFSLLGRMMPQSPASIQEMMAGLGQLPGQQAISGLMQRQMVPQALPQELPPEMMAERPMPGMTVGGLARGAAGALPILGESMDVQEIIRGIQERSPGRAAMGAAGLALPFVGFSGIFGGTRGASEAGKALLADARKMARRGESAEDIWRQTGWWVKSKEGVSPPQGKARFEIEDVRAKYDPKKAAGAKKLGDVFRHPDLYRNYPELKDINVEVMDLGDYAAAYVPASKRYGMPEEILIDRFAAEDPEMAKTAILHELQHAVQKREGFPYGVSVEQLMKKGATPEEAIEGYRMDVGEAEARATEARAAMDFFNRRMGFPWLSYDVPLR